MKLIRLGRWIFVLALIVSSPSVAQTSGWEFPTTSTYVATNSDFGKFLSTENVPGGSITVNLPLPTNVSVGWNMGFSEANGRGIIVNAPGGIFILAGQKTFTSFTAPSNVNYEQFVIQSDGTNFRLTSATDATARYNGIKGAVGGQVWTNIFSSGYSSTLADNGTTLSNKAANIPVTVTLPSTTLLPNGWAVTLYAVGNPITLQLNSVSGGALVSPEGTPVSTYVLSGGGATVSFDGGTFHVMNDVNAQTACRSVALYGGMGDGSTDNSAALIAALAAQGSTKCVSFPPGKFKFASTAAINISGTYAAITMRGSGAGVTELIGPTSSDLIDLTLAGQFNSFHFEDFSVETPSACTGCNGISISQSAITTSEGYTPTSDFTRVHFYGTDRSLTSGSNYWGTGILLVGVSNVNFESVFIQGLSTDITRTQRGIDVETASSNTPVIFNLHSVTINSAQNGLYLNDKVQGVTVSQSNFTNDENCIMVPAGAGVGSQLTVTGSSLTCGMGVYVNAPWGGVQITGNQFEIGQIGAPPNYGVILAATSQYATITGNLFAGTTTPNTFGMAVATTVNTGIVTGNVFAGLNFGVVLDPGDTGWIINPNYYTNDTFSVVNNTTFGNVIANNVYGGVPTAGSGSSDCGIGAAFQGGSTDQSGLVQVGSSPGSLCTITFSKPFLNQPICTASNNSSLARAIVPLFVSTTSMQLTSAVPLISGDFLAYHCDGWQ